MILLAIDPGKAKHNGRAYYDTETTQYADLKGVGIVDLVTSMVQDYKNNLIHGVVLEDPNLDSTIFRGQKYYNTLKGKFGHQRALAGAMKLGEDVGKNKGLAIIIEDTLISNSIPYIKIAPSKRRRIDKASLSGIALRTVLMPTKITAKQFNEMTGYGGKSNEHSRDAGAMVYRMTSAKFMALWEVQKRINLNNKSK